jgi:outer membrane receptor protein involved in Fe transport
MLIRRLDRTRQTKIWRDAASSNDTRESQMANSNSFAHKYALGREKISLLAVAASLAMASPAHADGTTGVIQGHVDGASAGTEIVATDTYTGLKKTARLDANGNYTFLELRPSAYQVMIPGKPAQDAVLNVGQTVVVDFVNTKNSAGDIVVTARVRREVRTAVIATSVTLAQIENLPQNSRDFLSFAALAPGITLSKNSGASQLQSGATSSQNSNLLLDGVQQKNIINHGGINGQNFGVGGNPFPQSAIQEYQVLTENAGPEVSQAGGAVINAITKSGGNHFHGGGYIEYQPNSFVPYGAFQSGPKPKYEREQFGVDLGGPIIKDKLFFYIAGEGVSQKLPGSSGAVSGAPTTAGGAGTPGSLYTLAQTRAPYILSAIQGVNHSNDFHQGLYFGKLTYLAGANDTINLSAFVRREASNGIPGNATPDNGSNTATTQSYYQLNWKHVDGGFTNQFNVQYDISKQGTTPFSTAPEIIVSADANYATAPSFNGNNTIQTGGATSYQNDRDVALTFKDDLVWRRAGGHTIKAGAQLIFHNLSRVDSASFSNGAFWYDINQPGFPSGGFNFTGVQPYAASFNLLPQSAYSGKDTLIGLYAGDEWKPNEHWTFNYGLRWDLETNQNNNNYVTPANVVTALQNYQGWKAAGINYQDYVSTGNNRKAEWATFQPRLGFSYDVNGDRDLVIFGGAGRYFDRNLFINSAIEAQQNSGLVVQNVRTCSATVTAPCLNVTANNATLAGLQTAGPSYVQAANLTGGSVWLLNNNTPLPFTDQLDLGFSKRVGKVQTRVTLTYQRSHNIFVFQHANLFTNGWFTRNLITNAAGAVIGCTNGGPNYIQDVSSNTTYPGCPAGGGQLAGFNGKLNIGQSYGQSDYFAISFYAEKPFNESSTWGFTTALTLQKARTNVNAEVASGDSVGGGNTSEEFQQSVIAPNTWRWAEGLPRWNWVSTASWRAPLGVTLTGILSLNGGGAFGNVNAPFNGGNPVVPNGACCRYETGVFFPNPLIAYKRLDLRLAKEFKMPFAHNQKLTFDFEVFNVFNWLNRNYSSWGAGGGSNPTLTEQTQINGDQRQFQAGIKYKF